jgi:ABC-type enterochelin transport system permease subunit
MANLSLKLDQLFILLVPELVVLFEGVSYITFPNEANFVQEFLTIKSKFVFVMKCPLLFNPLR